MIVQSRDIIVAANRVSGGSDVFLITRQAVSVTLPSVRASHPGIALSGRLSFGSGRGQSVTRRSLGGAEEVGDQRDPHQRGEAAYDKRGNDYDRHQERRIPVVRSVVIRIVFVLAHAPEYGGADRRGQAGGVAVLPATNHRPVSSRMCADSRRAVPKWVAFLEQPTLIYEHLYIIRREGD